MKKAQAHLKSLRAAAAAGRGVVKAKDDPTLADLERRVSVLQEQWREYQRRFTSNYLAIDPDATLINDILNNPAGFYFNVHTALHAGGVMRAQLVRTQ